MPRRSHKKSRSGCVQCKGRHIKCDETHPKCVNCSTAGSSCSFELVSHTSHKAASVPQLLLPPISGPPTPLSQLPGSNVPSPHSQARTPLTPIVVFKSAEQSSDDPGPPGSSGLNLLHLELLHNFLLSTHTTFTAEPAQQDVWCNTTIRHGLAFPFLMKQILAISALHLSHVLPDRFEYYHGTATSLQTEAMEGFRQIQTSIDERSCVAVLMFSSQLALHVLGDVTKTSGPDSMGYIEHFSSCISLMRSVYSLVVKDLWEYIHAQPELFALVKVDEPSKPPHPPYELQRLRKLIDNPNLPSQTQHAYDHAIERLAWLHAVSGVPHTVSSTVRWIIGWGVQVKEEYIKALNERRPEALIILAYYGAFLTFYRGNWVVRDQGSQLIRAINTHVGSYWQEWLEWPMQIAIAAEDDEVAGSKRG